MIANDCMIEIDSLLLLLNIHLESHSKNLTWTRGDVAKGWWLSETYIFSYIT